MVMTNVAPVAELGLDPRVAAVALGDVLHEREADAAAADLLLGRLPAAHEALEDATPLPGGDAGAVVADADSRRAPRRRARRR